MKQLPNPIPNPSDAIGASDGYLGKVAVAQRLGVKAKTVGVRGASAAGGLVLTREELAAVLQVSVRTVDRMATVEDIPVMDLGEDLVRFYLPDVLEALRSRKVKYGRRAVAGEEMGEGRSEIGNPEEDHEARAVRATCESRNVRAGLAKAESRERECR